MAATLLEITAVFLLIDFMSVFTVTLVCNIFFILSPPLLFSVISSNIVDIKDITNIATRRLTVGIESPCIASQCVLLHDV